MPTINASQLNHTINSIIGIISSEAEVLEIKLSKEKHSIDFHVHDKEKQLDIYASFPDVMDIEETKYFALEPKRFKSLINKQPSMVINLKGDTLHYEYPNQRTVGKIQTTTCEKFSFPKISDDIIDLNELVFGNFHHIKLNPLYKTREMMLFARYTNANKTIELCCADNFHAALLKLTNTRAGEKDFDISIPIKYIDIAKKFSQDNNDKISMAVIENVVYFYTPLVVIKLPQISTEDTNASMDNALAHFAKLKDNEEGTDFKLNFEKLNVFLANALSIKEEDKGAEIRINAKNNILSYRIETKIGEIKQSIDTSINRKGSITLSCAALHDLMSKATDTLPCSIIGTNFLIKKVIESKKTPISIWYTTIGVQDD